MSTQRALLKAIWPSARRDSERIVRRAVEARAPRTALNLLYDRLSIHRKARAHARFAKLFRDREPSADAGIWTVRFHGRKIRVPLRRQSMWLDWDSALSVLGHEPEIKTAMAYRQRLTVMTWCLASSA